MLSDDKSAASTTRCGRCSAPARSGAVRGPARAPRRRRFDLADLFGGRAATTGSAAAGFSDLFGTIFSGGGAAGAGRGPPAAATSRPR